MQPFTNPNLGPDPAVNAIELLAELSNVDKHRVVHVALALPFNLTLGLPPQLVDCAPQLLRAADGTMQPQIRIVDYRGKPIRVGDPVIYIPVIPTGPNPDVELERDLSCFIGLKIEAGATVPMLDLLDKMGRGIALTIRVFEPLL
jgi:hypothetical protein